MFFQVNIIGKVVFVVSKEEHLNLGPKVAIRKKSPVSFDNGIILKLPKYVAFNIQFLVVLMISQSDELRLLLNCCAKAMIQIWYF